MDLIVLNIEEIKRSSRKENKLAVIAGMVGNL